MTGKRLAGVLVAAVVVVGLWTATAQRRSTSASARGTAGITARATADTDTGRMLTTADTATGIPTASDTVLPVIPTNRLTRYGGGYGGYFTAGATYIRRRRFLGSGLQHGVLRLRRWMLVIGRGN